MSDQNQLGMKETNGRKWVSELNEGDDQFKDERNLLD